MEWTAMIADLLIVHRFGFIFCLWPGVGDCIAPNRVSIHCEDGILVRFDPACRPEPHVTVDVIMLEEQSVVTKFTSV